MECIKKILIVDDDIHARQLIQKVLKKLDSVIFLEAENGKEAIEIARASQPELILMDVVMPGIDGYEACRQIKNDPQLKSTTVIFMTYLFTYEIDDKIAQVQGDDLLRKPVDASELYFRVKNYLSLSMPPRGDPAKAATHPIKAIASVEETTVDLGKGFLYHYDLKCIRQDQRLIPLMKQEVLLLEILIDYKDRIVSYDQLLIAISEESMSSVANVRTLVKLLRSKTYSELIKNLNSYGYQLAIHKSIKDA